LHLKFYKKVNINQINKVDIAILALFVNFLLPPREFGKNWGGVKKLRLLQGLL